MQWGSANDGNRIFVAATNSGTSQAGGGTGAMPWKLKDGTTTVSGGWAAFGSTDWRGSLDYQRSARQSLGGAGERCQWRRVRLQPGG